MTIYFDMDGTIANLYNIKNWFEALRGYSVKPFENAKPLLNMTRLARIIHKLQAKGHKVCIISWTPPTDLAFYENKVEYAKIQWLKKHLPSVTFDEIYILPYKTPKYKYAKTNDILFDDEINNRKEWSQIGKAYDETRIFEILEKIYKNT